MNDLMRPSLYDAQHDILPVKEPGNGVRLENVDIVGPVCETGDTFATNYPMPPLEAGDLLAIRTAGAYGAVMASTYNSRPLIPEVLVRNGDFSLIRERMTVDTMLEYENLPNWIE